MSKHLNPLERLRQLKSEHPTVPAPTSGAGGQLHVKPFGGVKSSFLRNPIQWLRQTSTEGEVQTEVNGDSLRNLAERVKAWDAARTRSALYEAKVQEVRVDEQTERRAQRQFQASATNNCVGTSDAIETLVGYRSLKRPELEKALEGDPLKDKVLREYDLIFASSITLLRLNVYGQKNDPVGFGKEELL